MSAGELAILEPLGTRRAVEAGEVLCRAGDSAYDFFVVISAQVVEVRRAGRGRCHPRVGRLLGELNLLTGCRVFLTAPMVEPGEVLAVPVASLRLVLATEPSLGEKLLAETAA